MESILREFRDAAADPCAHGRKLKAKGRKVIGSFCTYTPEEIVCAAGIHPLRLFGDARDVSRADVHLQPYCCSLVRGALAGALGGDLDFLDGTVFPHTCDSIQRLSDIWRLNTGFGFFADVVLPVKLTTKSSRDYMRDVLEKFRTDIEKGFGLEVTPEVLKGSFRTYNTIRGSLKALYELASDGRSPLGPADLNALVKGSMILDRQEAARLLEELVGMHGDFHADEGGLKRVMLAGGVCDHPDIYAILERSGAKVVWDDLCTGSRYFEGAIDEASDPMDALADRYFNRIVCPAKHTSVRARADHLVKLAREHRVSGIVFLHLKFCDPHSFDYPDLKAALEKESIPSMLLEIETALPPEGQLMTRFETFVQTI